MGTGNQRLIGTAVRGLIVAPLLLLGVAHEVPALAAGAPTYSRTVGGPSVAAMYSSGLDYDAGTGRIVLAETGLNQVVFYNPDGTRLGGFGSIGADQGQFDTPRDVAVDPASNIYVADTSNGRVQKFTSAGVHVWTSRGLKHPMGIGFDVANNQVLVASTAESRIRSLDPADGAPLWTSPAGTTLNISSPRDVARGPDGRVWVTDYRHHQIKAFNVSAGGNWTTSPAVTLSRGKGKGDNQLAFPYNVGFSPDGLTAYVADTGNARIARWDLSDSSPRSLSAFGGRCPEFRDPCADPPADKGFFDTLRRVAVMPDGKVIGDDFWGNGLQIFRPDGTVAIQIEGAAAPAPGFAQAFGVAVAGDGTTYVVDRLNQRVQRFNAAGVFQNAAGSRGSAAQHYSWPESAAVAPNGAVWVLDSQHDTMKRWSADLSSVTPVPSNQSSGSALGQFRTPKGITVAADGTVWVADSLNNRVQRYNPATGVFTAFGTRGTAAGQLMAPEGIAVSSSAFFVADTRNNRIQKFGLNGAFLEKSSVPLSSPQGVALAPDGTLWVADTGNHRIVHLSAELTDLGETFGSFGTGNTQFYQPHSLVATSTSLFVADTFNHRVQVFDLDAS